MSLFGPESIFNINRGVSPIGFGVIHPLPPSLHSQYQVQPLISHPTRGSIFDLINTSYEPFLLLLALAGAGLSFLLYQAIVNNGRRKKRETWPDFLLTAMVVSAGDNKLFSQFEYFQESIQRLKEEQEDHKIL